MIPEPSDPLGEIPPDHPWYRAIVKVVRDLRSESYPGLVSPPGTMTNAATREYDAGRVAMADDVLTRLQNRFTAAQRRAAE